MRTRTLTIIALLSVLPLTGCKDRRLELVGSRDPEVESRTISEGVGLMADQGKKVAVHYVGRLPDGSVFMDTSSKGSPHRWTVGDGSVIKGMDLGIVGMKPGAKRILTIPPELHWGRAGYGGVIPENTELTFEVTMVTVN